MITALYDAFKLKQDFKVELSADVALHRMSAINKIKGVSVIAWIQNDKHGYGVALATVKLRTRGSGYRSLLRTYLHDSADMQKVLDAATEALSYVPIVHTTLPEPWTFSEQKYNIQQ
jgi:hypothetical protein